MIFIVVKFPVKPEYADRFGELTRPFTEATRAEPGNKWFEWSRSLDDPSTYVLVEVVDEYAAAAHVNSAHFQQMTREFPQYLTATPKIVSRTVDGDDWDDMGEVRVPPAS